MAKILNLFGDAFSDEAKAILTTAGTVEYRSLDRKKLLQEIGSYEVLITGLQLSIDREVLEHAKNLKIIATPTTGLDHIDLAFAKERGIEVLSLRGEEEFLRTITGTAELACTLMLTMLRQVIPASESVKKGEWHREEFMGRSAAGLTLGIVGVGRLGSMMARYGNSLGMQVLGSDPKRDSDGTWKKVELSQLLAESDVVSIHVHLSPETEHLFSAVEFSQMKSGAILINTSRGGVVNEKDLLEALKKGIIGGYGTDVLDGELEFEGDASKHPLVQFAKKHDNILITPHIGGMTEQARRATDVWIATKVMERLKN